MNDWGKIESNWNESEPLINVEKDTDNSGVEDMAEKKYKKYVEKTYQIIQQLNEVGLPKTNEQIRIITLRSFNSVHFLKYISDLEIIEKVLLCVYSINGEAARMLNEMVIFGKVKKMVILMSNLRNKAHREKEQITRDMFVNNPNIDLFFASSHAKIMSIKTDKNYYTIEGSGNMSYNSRIEQYILDNDKKLFEFTENWMNEVKIFLKGKKELVLT
jgi:hypothetical protein